VTLTKVLRRTKGTSGNQVVKYRHVDGQVFDANVVGYTSGALSTPGQPTVTPQGTTGATAYSYRIVARNSSGVTLPGTAGTTATGNAALSASNFNRVSWSAVANAESYDVYGRTGGSELLIANVSGTTYDDTGATPSGALPGSNTTAAGYNIRVPALKTASAPTITMGNPVTITPAVTRVGGGLNKFAVQQQTSRAQTGVLLTTGAR
jgi:hypothetical protein